MKCIAKSLLFSEEMSPIALLIVCLMTVAPVLSKTYLVETKDEIHKGNSVLCSVLEVVEICIS